MIKAILILAALITLAFNVNGAHAADAACDENSFSLKSDKIGIIIANSNYVGGSIPSVLKDVKIISSQLHSNGYAVGCFLDSASQELNRRLDQLQKSLLNYRGDVFIYFSGHGWGESGKNYFVGTEAQLASANSLKSSSSSIDNFVKQISFSKARQIVLILDICRKLTPGGLQLQRPSNVESNVLNQIDMVIGYSAGFGSSAYPGVEYSPYAGALATYMDPENGLSVQEILGKVGQFFKLDKGRLATQIPSFISMASRELFLDTSESGLKGMQSFDDYKEIGAVLLDEEVKTNKERQNVFKGIYKLVDEGGFFGDKDCDLEVKQLTDQARVQGGFENMKILRLPTSLVDNIGVSHLYAVDFGNGGMCFASADGNSRECIIGLEDATGKWINLWCGMVTALALKHGSHIGDSEHSSLIATMYVGSMTSQLTLYWFVPVAHEFETVETVSVPVDPMQTSRNSPSWLGPTDR